MLTKVYDHEFMVNNFRKLGSREVIGDLELYIKNYVKENPSSFVIVGCDSQNQKRFTNYVTCIVFLQLKDESYRDLITLGEKEIGNDNITTGGHIIYLRDRMKRIKSLWTKLEGEVLRTHQVAQFVNVDCGVNVDQINLDYNMNVASKSNLLYKAYKGTMESFGYDVRAKNFDPANPDKTTVLPATVAADKILR
jgi:predicted RNase H-related nuclease YkuK (DUF458 family)